MKKIFLRFFSLLMILGLFCCEAEKKIKIGFIGPLTGGAAGYGKLMSQAVKLAVEERNESGGVAGMRVEFIAEDSEGKPERAGAAIEKLVTGDKIMGLIGAVFSSSSLSIAPRCEAEKIVMISPSSAHKDLTNKGKYIFRDVASDDLQSVIFAKYCYQELGLRKIAVLYVRNDYSRGLAESFKDTFEAEGGEIVAMESGLQNDKDFKTQLARIKELSAEAVFLPNYISEIARILEQVQQLEIDAVMLSADGFANPEIFTLAGELANGVIFSGPAVEDTEFENPRKTAFERKYREKYGEKPDSFSLNAYDAANLLMDAIEYAYKEGARGEKVKELIREYIAGTEDYMGVSGNITFAENGDVIKNQGILTVENMEYRQIGIYTITREGELQRVQ